MNAVLMTDYFRNDFRNDVLVKRSYLRVEWCAKAIASQLCREVQIEDGRIRHWVFVPELGRYPSNENIRQKA